jgi:hypothetical protein
VFEVCVCVCLVELFNIVWLLNLLFRSLNRIRRYVFLYIFPLTRGFLVHWPLREKYRQKAFPLIFCVQRFFRICLCHIFSWASNRSVGTPAMSTIRSLVLAWDAIALSFVVVRYFWPSPGKLARPLLVQHNRSTRAVHNFPQQSDIFRWSCRERTRHEVGRSTWSVLRNSRTHSSGQQSSARGKDWKETDSDLFHVCGLEERLFARKRYI